MGKTQAVHYRGQEFWAYDAALAVWLMELVDAARRQRLQDDPWWAEQMHDWKVFAVTSDLGLDLPEDWSPEQRDLFLKLANEATKSIKQHTQLDGHDIISRTIDGALTSAERYKGLDTIATEPIVSLGEAIVQLIHGTLPPSPAGTWWFFGFEPQPKTIAMHESKK